MNATARTLLGLGLRLIAWAALVLAQVIAIGMSVNASFGIDPYQERATGHARLWALALPVIFTLSVVPLFWRKPPALLEILGGIYALVGGVIVVAFTLLLLQDAA
jgi:hypothetical protein